MYLFWSKRNSGLHQSTGNLELIRYLPENNSGKFYYGLNDLNPHKALTQSANYSFWSNSVLLCKREWSEWKCCCSKKCSIFSNAARNSDANLLQRMSEVQMPTEHENQILFLSGVLEFSWKPNQLSHPHCDQSKNSTVNIWVTLDKVSHIVRIVPGTGIPLVLVYLMHIRYANGSQYGNLKFLKANGWNNAAYKNLLLKNCYFTTRVCWKHF